MYEAVREVIGIMVDDVLVTTGNNLSKLQPTSVEDIRFALEPVAAFSSSCCAI